MRFRSPYNFDSDVLSSVTGVSLDPDQDRAWQASKDECDINNLVKAFTNGLAVPGADIPPMVFEIDRVIDYQTALNELKSAEAGFMALPSDVRSYFDNDPGLLLDFVNTPSNRDEAIKLGLIPPPPPDHPVLTRLSEALDAVKTKDVNQAAPPSVS